MICPAVIARIAGKPPVDGSLVDVEFDAKITRQQTVRLFL
jgi:hypothetical protein